MNEIIELNSKILIVSANLRGGNIYKKLYEISPKFNIVAGTCPTVGITGYTLGGGHGIMTSYYGITAHYLESAKIVLPSGEFKEVSDQNDPEIMWALRGGGHNLGIVTELKFNYESIPEHNWNLLLLINPSSNNENTAKVCKFFEV